MAEVLLRDEPSEQLNEGAFARLGLAPKQDYLWEEGNEGRTADLGVEAFLVLYIWVPAPHALQHGLEFLILGRALAVVKRKDPGDEVLFSVLMEGDGVSGVRASGELKGPIGKVGEEGCGSEEIDALGDVWDVGDEVIECRAQLLVLEEVTPQNPDPLLQAVEGQLGSRFFQ